MRSFRFSWHVIVSGLLACWWLGAGVAALASTPTTVSRPLAISVTNTLALARKDEVLVLPLAKILNRRPAWKSHPLEVHVVGHVARLPTQRYASHGGATPNQLLVLLSIAPHAKIQLRIQRAHSVYVPKVNPLYARLVPERYDDFAWENDLVTFRIYGTPLEAQGLTSSGIDVWSKRPPRHVINAWYARNELATLLHDPALAYHVDHGDGLDSYLVGHSPGDGGTAAWMDGAPVYSSNATHERVTAMGPVRLRFVVSYAPWRVGKAEVRARKVITLDAGSHINRQVVHYQITGARHLVAAAGVAVHAGAQVVHVGPRIIAVWDTPQKKSAGHIATGLILPKGENAHYTVGTGAVWVLFDVVNGSTTRFASGAGWSKGDMPNFRTWQRYLRDYRKRWTHPLQVQWPVKH